VNRSCTVVVPLLLLTACQKAPNVGPNQIGWIHSDGHVLRDEYGRQWLHRGINARVEGLFDVTFTDGRQPVESIPAFDQSDVQQMAAFGFNFLRLPINWSGLEPTEGTFPQAYLDRLAQVIQWCGQAGMYVLIDFHQDAWSKEIGEDGEPLWAIQPPPTMLLGGPLTDLTQRRESAQVTNAFVSFFGDVDMLEERFVPAWQKVISLHASEPQVIGFEPMNEPFIDILDPNGESELQAFYEKMDTALRAVDKKHSFWIEPDAYRNQSLSAPLRATPFPDSNLVYEPHMYPLSGPSENTDTAWVSYLQSTFNGMVTEAQHAGGAPFLGEWGADPSKSMSSPYVQCIEELIEPLQMGEAFWLWKEISQGNWGFYDQTADGGWTLRADGLQQVTLPYPMAVPGTLKSFHFDRPSATLTVEFKAAGGEAAPLLFLAPNWYPNGVTVTLNGKGVDVGTGRVNLPWSGQSGSFTVVAAPKG
jgi:endoglycosylceramidase